MVVLFELGILIKVIYDFCFIFLSIVWKLWIFKKFLLLFFYLRMFFLYKVVKVKLFDNNKYVNKMKILLIVSVKIYIFKYIVWE